MALVLASLMILTLAACNKKQQLGTSLPEASPDAHAVSDKLQETKTESPTAQTEEEFHWERVQTPLPDGESTIWAQAEAHGTVIAGTHKQLFALENGSWNELPVPDDFLYGNALCEDADGGFWFLYTTMNNSLAIARYGTDFAVQETFLTSCENEDQLYFQLLKTDGEFYLLSRERLVRLDENGALTVQDVDDTRDGRYFDSMAEVNGTLYVLAPTAFDNVEHSYDELRQLDPATLEETAVLLEKLASAAHLEKPLDADADTCYTGKKAGGDMRQPVTAVLQRCWIISPFYSISALLQELQIRFQQRTEQRTLHARC